ncbi:MAG: tyrosine-protein kinase family protein [Gammaproteobacteria bacterium]
MPDKNAKPLGSIAVDLGYTSQEQVEEALKEQRSRQSSGKNRVFIGNLMQEMGALTPEQLFRVLSKSGDLGAPISEDAIRLAGRIKSDCKPEGTVITVTSAARGEGVTTVASQLATAMALMIEGAILLVDANIPKPSIHEKFGIERSPGFTDVIEGHFTLGQAVKRTEIPGLWVLPSGGFIDDFLIMLMNDTCTQILNDMRDMGFQYIIIDTPPILGHSEAALISARSDGAILVVRADKRRKSEVIEMKRVLDGFKVNILGSLLRK